MQNDHCMKRALLPFFFLIALLSAHHIVPAQQADTFTVNLRQYVIGKIPLPGQPMQVSRFPFTGDPNSTNDTILEFKHVEIGKWDGVRMFVAVKGNRIVATGIEAKGEKTVKAIRKQLVKDFGSPFGLELYKTNEVLSWIPNDRHRYHIRFVSPPDDGSCRVWLRK